MPTTLAFKDILDLPKWRPLAPAPAASTAGSSLAFDMRGGGKAHPLHYLLSNATTFSAYSPQNDEWIGLSSPALAGAFGAGASSIVHPTQGPRGTLAAGGTTTSVVLSTALPAAVAVNQLANRGDGVGFTLRVIGNAAGSSGKVEERLIIANTAGTTPTLTLDAALTFTPAVGDTYEILSGRVFLLSAGTLAAGIWKHYDIATNSYSGNLSTTNLPATIGGDSSLVALSEGYVPNDALPGAGFLGVLTATTGATSTTIVQGTASAPALAANEYRNFQIRITEDTATPTAVGQRRRIASHTAGASPTWTVASAWTVTPSATAKFVIENDDDKLLLFTNQTGIYTYNITANSWDTSSFAAAANAGELESSVSTASGLAVIPPAMHATASSIGSVVAPRTSSTCLIWPAAPPGCGRRTLPTATRA